MVQGLSLLIHHHHQMLLETPFTYPAVSVSLGDHATMVLQDRSLHTLQQVDGVEVRECPLKTLDTDLNGN